MALRFLLDSDVIIWHLRGHEPTEELLKIIELDQPIGCSALSVFEILAGVRPEEREKTHQFLAPLHKIPMDGAIAARAADYWREFRRQGMTIGQADVMIAATAHEHRLVLATYNRSHYPMQGIMFYEPMPELG